MNFVIAENADKSWLYEQSQKLSRASVVVRARASRCATLRARRAHRRRIPRARIRSVKRSRCFFRRAGVIRMQCASIPDGTDPTSPLIMWLGGQKMAKKRKAKKAAKKTTKRRKKK